mgnify:CR=1 FL=1
MQGLVVTSSGLIFEHEHGPKGGDELNIIKPSLNYGWPAITYGIDYSGAVISPFTEKDGMEQPLFYWIPSIAPSDMIFYEKDLYPELKNNFLITALVSKDVKQINKNDLIFLPLGGSSEIGMNSNLYHYDDNWIMVDLGISFADESMPGVDILLPDIDFIVSKSFFSNTT